MSNPTAHDIAVKVTRSHLDELRDMDAMSIGEIADADLTDDEIDAVCEHIDALADRMERTLTEEATTA